MRVTLLAGVLDPNYHWKIRLLSKVEVRKKMYMDTDDLCCLLISLSPVNEGNGKIKQPNSGRANNGPDPSGIKV